MRRLSVIIRCLALSAITCFGAVAAAAQGGITLSQTPTRTDLHVVVVQNNDHPVAEMYHVHLISSRSVPISDQATDNRGEAVFYSIPEGNYHLTVAGGNIEPVDTQIAIYRGENSHYEYVHTKPKSSDTQPTSAQGTVSSAALSIPDNARKEFDKGMVAFDKQDYTQAQQRLLHATELYPHYSLAFVNLGIIAMKQNRSDDGAHYFETAIKADPQDPTAYVDLGRLDIMQKKYSDAENLLTKAVSITPLNPEALMMLAASELYQGKLDEAIESAKRVHAVPHEKFAVAHLLAAQAYTKKDQLGQAADEYRMFLKESPDSPNAASARAALQSIESRQK